MRLYVLWPLMMGTMLVLQQLRLLRHCHEPSPDSKQAEPDGTIQIDNITNTMVGGPPEAPEIIQQQEVHQKESSSPLPPMVGGPSEAPETIQREIRKVNTILPFLPVLPFLPPCRVLVINSADHHTEILESIATQIPTSVLALKPEIMKCNPKKLIFDYRIQGEKQHELKTKKKLPRAAFWLRYFNHHMRGTTTTDADGVTRSIRNGKILDYQLGVVKRRKVKQRRRVKRRRWRLRQKLEAQEAEEAEEEIVPMNFQEVNQLWYEQRATYTTFDDSGQPYHAIVEGTCYCGTNPDPYIYQRKWIADWMLGSRPSQSRVCVFHEKCDSRYHTERAIWVSPHFDNYFIPSALPLAQLSGKVRPQKWTTQQSAPVICSIGTVSYRHFDYLKPYLELHEQDKTNVAQVQFHILGRGEFPFPEEDRDIVHQFANIADDLEFARHLKEDCDVITLLINPQSHPGYFNGPDSAKRLSGSIPSIIAYNKPFLMHEELLELYSRDLLPPALDVPYATFDDSIESYLPAVEELVNQMQS